jgi:hypothetical protein
MKKLLLALAAVALCTSYAVADEKTVVVTAAGATTYSDPINVSGYIERVEIVRTPAPGSAVVDIDLGTFSGTTLMQSIVNIDAAATNFTPVAVIPRVVGTTVAGVALTAAVSAGPYGEGTNGVATTVLIAPYERIMAGGNLKLKVTALAGTNATVTAVIHYERSPK